MARKAFVACLCAGPFAALFACNAILGAGDYKVGHDDSDGGDTEETGGGTGAGGAANGGKATSTGGRATGAGGRATAGTGGTNTGTGGRATTGGTTSTGGRAAGGTPTTGAGGSPTSATDAFVGQWDSIDEVTVDDCSGAKETMTDGTDTLHFAAGQAGHIIVGFLSCTLDATVSGKKATLLPNQSCDEQGITYTFASGTFTIQANGTALLDERATISLSAGSSCNVEVTGTFTKYASP